jgi:hypothetical protein
VVLGALIGQTEAPSSAFSTAATQRTPPSGLSTVLNSVSQLSSAYGFPSGKTGTSLDALVQDPSHLFGEMPTTRSSANAVVPQMIQQLFGTQADQTVRILSNLCGVKNSSMTSLLALTVPLVFSGLSRLVSKAGLPFNVASLSSILTTIAPHISKALPSGLASMLSLGSVMNGIASRSTTTSSGFAPESRPKQPEIFSQPISKKRDLEYAPLLTLLVLLGSAWYFWNSSTIRSGMLPGGNRKSAMVTDTQAKPLSYTQGTAHSMPQQNIETQALEAAPTDRSTSEGEKTRAMLADIADAGALVRDSTRTPVLTTLTLPNGNSVAGVPGKIDSQLIALFSSTAPSIE